MPVCNHCERMAASAELRRTPKGHVCKDKMTCKARKQKARAAAKAAIRAATK